MQILTNSINKILYRIYKRKNPLLAEVILNWQKIAGTKYINNSFPVRISTIKEGKKDVTILTVEVSNSASSVELVFQQDILIERIAIYIGYKAVDKIKTVVHY